MKQNMFIKQGKTSWVHISIILVLATLVGAYVFVNSQFYIPESYAPFLNHKTKENIGGEFVDLDEKIAELSSKVVKENEMEEFLPYETHEMVAEFEGYMGSILTGVSWDIYYKYGGEKVKFEITPEGQDKYFNDYYEYVLKIYNAERNEYESVEEERGDGLGVYAYAKNNEITWVWQDFSRIGCCRLFNIKNVLIYNPILKQKSFKATNYESLLESEASPPTDFLLFSADNALYLNSKNEITFRFGNVYDSVSSADKYYLIEDGKFKDVDGKFKDTYLLNAYEIQKYIKEEDWSKNNNWLSSLINRTLNLILAEKEDVAWKTFNGDFLEFSEKYPSGKTTDLTLEEIKAGVSKKLAE